MSLLSFLLFASLLLNYRTQHNPASTESVVQASIVIITTAAGRLQDLSPTNSLDPAVSLWLAYAFVSVFFSGLMLYLSHYSNLLPASTLSQITPAYKKAEVDRMWSRGLQDASSLRGEMIDGGGDGDELSWEEKEKVLKAPRRGSKTLVAIVAPAVGMGIILLGWVMFGLGVSWVSGFLRLRIASGVHGMTGVLIGDILRYLGRAWFGYCGYGWRVRWLPCCPGPRVFVY